MKRMTKHSGHYHAPYNIVGVEQRSCGAECRQRQFYCKDCPINAAFVRLAAYEDTGLTPEDVARVVRERDAVVEEIDKRSKCTVWVYTGRDPTSGTCGSCAEYPCEAWRGVREGI